MSANLGMGGNGSGSGGPKKPPSKKKVEKPWWLAQIDKAEAYYRHCRIGLTAHPAFSEENENLEHFGIPVEMKVIGVHQVPVLPCGWHTSVVDC